MEDNMPEYEKKKLAELNEKLGIEEVEENPGEEKPKKKNAKGK